MTLLLWTLGCAKPADPIPPKMVGADQIRAELVMDGPLEGRLATDDEATLAIVYGGEQKGSMEPCGCGDRPRGGLPRMVAYRDAISTPVLTVLSGYFLEDAMGLDGTPRADVPVMNTWMARGLTEGGFDALNVGYNDMAGLTTIEGDPGLPLVSANIGGSGISRFRRFERGGQTVFVTGISTPGVTFLQTPGFVVVDPLEAAREVLGESEEQELRVLLSYAAPEAARTLAEEGLVDVVIDTNLHNTFDPPFRVGSAIWVRSHLQTMRVGELRLTLGDDGHIEGVLDRKIDLDDQIEGTPAMEALAESARAQLGEL